MISPLRKHSPDLDELVRTMHHRMASNGPLLDEMIEVQRRYNGEWVLPHVTREDNPNLPPLTPQVIASAIDNSAMRASSVLPYISCPAINPQNKTGRNSLERAMTRRRILAGTWHFSKMKLLMRRAYRHLAGYATCSMIVLPDFVNMRPRVSLRDPLTSYPELKSPEDLTPPINVGFTYAKSADWVRANFPSSRAENGGPIAYGDDEIWELCEWWDEWNQVLAIMGPRPSASPWSQRPDARLTAMEIASWENKAGMVPVVIPARITLDRIVSQVAHITGLADLMAQMMLLEMLAAEKNIFGDRYIVGTHGKIPRIVGGEWKDGREGEMNIVLDADSIGELKGAPDQMGFQAIDRLERNIKVSTNQIPQMMGENPGSLRTGRALDTMAGNSIDPHLQELQEIMEAALPQVNEAIFQTYRGYWPENSYTQFSGWPGDTGHFKFVPNIHIETTENTVAYAIAGADVQATTIQLGQLLGTKGISLRSFRQRHPWILDPDLEASAVDGEQMEEAVLQTILQGAVSGQIPLVFLASVERHRREQNDIFKAIEAADAEIRAKQAAEAPPAPEGAVAPPEMQPGLAGTGPDAVTPGGMGSIPFDPGIATAQEPVGSATPPIGPTQDQQGFRQVLSALMAGNSQVQAAG